MKRGIITYLLLLMSAALLGQTQQGRVKTIGRPNKAGLSLSGVTVRVSGDVNTVVTNTEGGFSFPLRKQRFRFSRISKKGYELADMDFLHYEFGFSYNPRAGEQPRGKRVLVRIDSCSFSLGIAAWLVQELWRGNEGRI